MPRASVSISASSSIALQSNFGKKESSSPRQFAFNRDASLLLEKLSTSGEARIWDAARGSLLRRFPHPCPQDFDDFATPTFSWDGTVAAFGATSWEGGVSAYVVDTITGELIQRFDDAVQVSYLSISPDGRFTFASNPMSDRNSLDCGWLFRNDVDDRFELDQRLTDDQGCCYSPHAAAFSISSDRAIVGYSNCILSFKLDQRLPNFATLQSRIPRLETGTTVESVKYNEADLLPNIELLAISPDGRRAFTVEVAASDSYVLETMRSGLRFRTNMFGFCLSLQALDELPVELCSTGAADPASSTTSRLTYRLWDVESGLALFTFSEFPRLFQNVEFSPDSGSMLAVDTVGKASILSCIDGTEVAGPEDADAFFSFGVFCPSGSMLVALADRAGIALWDPLAGLVARLETDSVPVTAMSFCDNGSAFVGICSDQLVRWQISSPIDLGVFDDCDAALESVGGADPVASVAARFPIGHLLLLDTQDAGSWFGDFDRPTLSEREPTAAAFSFDGEALAATFSDNSLQLFCLESVGVVTQCEAAGSIVRELVFSPDGSLVAGNDRRGAPKIYVWETATGRLVNTVQIATRRTGSEQSERLTVLGFSDAGTGLVVCWLAGIKTVRLENSPAAVIFEDLDFIQHADLYPWGGFCTLAKSGTAAEGAIDHPLIRWDVADSTWRQPVLKDEPIAAWNRLDFFSFSGDGNTVLASFGGAGYQVWDLRDGRCVLERRLAELEMAALSHDGTLAYGTINSRAGIGEQTFLVSWAVPSGVERSRIVVGFEARVCAVSACNRRLVTCDYRKGSGFRVWQLT